MNNDSRLYTIDQSPGSIERPHHALPEGTEIAGLVIGEMLGHGGFGLVYKAWSERLKRHVAIKEYLPTNIAGRQGGLTIKPFYADKTDIYRRGLQRFVEEARILASIPRSLNIVHVLDCVEANGTAYLIMEYLAGKTMAQEIAQHADRLTPERLDRWLTGLLRALHELHSRKLIHRDIKPDNIYISDNDEPVLIDFGASRQIVGALTQTIDAVVSIPYSPIEQYSMRGELPQGPASDLYALAQTFYPLVSGLKPHAATDRFPKDRQTSLLDIKRKDYPTPWLEAMQKALNVSMELRPQSAQEWLSNKGFLVDGKYIPPGVGTGNHGASQPVDRKPHRQWLLVSTVLLGGIALGWAASRFNGRGDVPPHVIPPAPVVTTPVPAPTKPAPGVAFSSCDIATCPEMIWLPAGEFEMGSSSKKNEQPPHKVKLANLFAVSRYPITFSQWDACVAAGGCSHKPGDQGWGRADRPVININWNDAQAYVAWLQKHTQKPYRLLSEAEWEYAARAKASGIYPWGDAIGQNHANCAGCGSEWDNKQTAPVASFANNAYGLSGMVGNVWVWLQDCARPDYTQAPVDGAAVSGQCSQRAIRGGSWLDAPERLRITARQKLQADGRYDNVGLRVALSQP